MDQKTLIGFILIGAILLFWPTYLDFISPESEEVESSSPIENTARDVIQDVPAVSVIKTSKSSGFLENIYTVETPLFTAGISNKNGGSLSSFLVTKHLKGDESFLDLIDEENKGNLLVSYINQSGEEVFLDDFWSESSSWFVDGKNSVVLNEENPIETLSYVLRVGEDFVQKDLTFSYNSYEVVVNTNLRGIKNDVLDGNFRLDWVGAVSYTHLTLPTILLV